MFLPLEEYTWWLLSSYNFFS